MSISNFRVEKIVSITEGLRESIYKSCTLLILVLSVSISILTSGVRTTRFVKTTKQMWNDGIGGS